jgi:hypothetical protein
MMPGQMLGSRIANLVAKELDHMASVEDKTPCTGTSVERSQYLTEQVRTLLHAGCNRYK